MEQGQSISDGASSRMERKRDAHITMGAAGMPEKDNSVSESESEDRQAFKNEKHSDGSDELSHGSDDEDVDNGDGLSDYEKLRLERIRRNQEYLSRLGLEEEKSKWKPQKIERKRKNPPEQLGETTRKASLRTKTEQVRYSDISMREILGEKPRAGKEPKPKKQRQGERPPQHRMERYIYREFQRIQAERNNAQKQIEQLVRKIEKEAAYWKKLLEQKENRSHQARKLELESERAVFGGLTLKQFMQQIDQRMPELVQAAADYDREMEERRRNGRHEAEKQQKQLQIRRLVALDIYPVLLKNAFHVLDEILFERFAGICPPQRRSSRSNLPVTVSKSFPKIKPQAIPENLSEKFVEGCGSYNGQAIADYVGGWISPQYASLIDRSWLDRKDIFVPQAGDIVLYYPVGHRLFLQQHPDKMGEKNPTRIPLWETAEKDKPADTAAWWNKSWLQSVSSNQAIYPLLCRVTETHFEFPPDDPFIMSYGEDGSVIWKRREKAAGIKLSQCTSLHLAMTLRPLTPVLPEALPLPPCFSVAWFPSDDAKPFLIPFQQAYTNYQSLSIGVMVTAEKSSAAVQGFATLDEKSTRLDEYLPSLVALVENTALSISETLEQEMETVSRGYRIAAQEWRTIVELIQKKIDMISSVGKHETLVNNNATPVFSLIRLTLPLWEGVAVVPKSNKRVAMPLSPWELKFRDSHFPLGIFERSNRDLIEFIIDRTVLEHAESDLFHEIVTNEEAPSYSCAVPISMSTSKILKRLRCNYYRSINSILNDANAILGNCLLYNSPDAPIVSKARSFVATIHSNINEAVVQSDKVHSGLKTSCILHMDDACKFLYWKPTNTSPYKGAFKHQWMHNEWSWTPQTGDDVTYSKPLHDIFLESHSCDFTEDQCGTVANPAGDKGEIEAEVLWTKPCFPRQRRKNTLGTFNDDAPIIEVGLRLTAFPKIVTTVYWRQCILVEAGALQCHCACPGTFLRKTERSTNSDLSRSDSDSVSLIFAVLKQRCLEQRLPSMLDPKLTKKAVKDGSDVITYSLASTMDSLTFDPSSISPNPIQPHWDNLAMYGFLPYSDILQSTDLATLAYPYPELCLELVAYLLKKGHYRSLGSVINDIIESFIDAVSTRLVRLGKIEKGLISLKNIALGFFTSDEVNDEERRFMDAINPIRDVHAAALASVAGVEVALPLVSSTKKTTHEICEPDPTRDSARHALAVLFSALGRDPALNCMNLLDSQTKKVKIKCAGKTVINRKEVSVFDKCTAHLGGTQISLQIVCEGRPFLYECDLDEMNEDNEEEQSVHAGGITSVDSTCVTFSKDELEKYNDIARIFLGQPGKMHACARCQAKRRSFLECRIQRRHSNMDFDWKATFSSFGGIDGLVSSLHPDRREIKAVSQGEVRNSVVSVENHHESVANLRTAYHSCRELLEKAKSTEAHIQHISDMPVRLSSRFLEESFPVDPTDGRYSYCIICGISGDLFCCDKCPNVFHSICLGLENVPAGEYFCDECNSKQDGVSSNLPFARSELDVNQLDEIDEKLTSIRSLRADRIKRQNSDCAKTNDNDQDEIENEEGSEIDTRSIESVPRRRGRPRKDVSLETGLTITTEIGSPRRQGRPRNTNTNDNAPDEIDDEEGSEIDTRSIEPVPRRRGRPRKDELLETGQSIPTGVGSSRRQGRPRNANDPDEIDNEEGSEIDTRLIEPVPRRRGRPGKDELIETGQSIATGVGSSRRQGIPRNTEQMIKSAIIKGNKSRPLRFAQSAKESNLTSRAQQILLSNVNSVISARSQNQSMSRATISFHQSRSNFTQTSIAKKRGRLPKIDSPRQKRLRASRNDNCDSDHLQPHRFVGELEIEKASVSGDKNGRRASLRGRPSMSQKSTSTGISKTATRKKRGRPPKRDSIPEPILKLQKSEHISSANNMEHLRPHQFVEDLEFENTTFTARKSVRMVRKIGRMQR